MKRWTRRKRQGGTEYIPGDYNVIDDLHGFKLKRSECKMRWDGRLVPEWDYEERHPLDFVRSVKERIKVKDTRPEPEDVFNTNVTADDL